VVGILGLSEKNMVACEHDEMVAFIDSYPWELKTQHNTRANPPSIAFWEPPSSRLGPTLVAFKKFAKKGSRDFTDKGHCFIVSNPNYHDINGKKWRKFDGIPMCLMERASGVFTRDDLKAVAGSHKNFRFFEDALWCSAVKIGAKLEKTDSGVIVHEV
jgi:hypothetical protein